MTADDITKRPSLEAPVEKQPGVSESLDFEEGAQVEGSNAAALQATNTKDVQLSRARAIALVVTLTGVNYFISFYCSFFVIVLTIITLS